jgi:tRNA U34 5-methylaminomethyl-2-thiouridine-forming methyltransferase MnmC
MQTDLVISADGSHTLFVPGLNEHYHSVHGAVQESVHVFINAGLKACEPQQINILEIGFGTGLNALLTFLETESNGKTVNYFSYEPFPLAPEVWKKLNYPEIFKHAQAAEAFEEMHTAAWGRGEAVAGNFVLCKNLEKIEDAELKSNHFHLVYFDAFAPAVQPELWTNAVFNKIFEACTKDAILVTYSATGQVRRNLESTGFEVERIPGPPGKREMLRAKKML